mgnify:CR=1 FL=1
MIMIIEQCIPHTNGCVLIVAGPLIPINDIGDTETPLLSRDERNLRCKLASVYRLIDIRGWANSMCNNITVSCLAS